MNDPELRAELEEEMNDSDMDSDDDGNDDDKDQDFEVDMDWYEKSASVSLFILLNSFCWTYLFACGRVVVALGIWILNLFGYVTYVEPGWCGVELLTHLFALWM